MFDKSVWDFYYRWHIVLKKLAKNKQTEDGLYRPGDPDTHMQLLYCLQD